MKIPEKVKVGPFMYEVEWQENRLRDQRGYGTVTHSDHTIKLDKSVIRERIEETFLHEVIHAVDDLITGGQDEAKTLSEAQVQWLGSMLYMVLKENGMLAE